MPSGALIPPASATSPCHNSFWATEQSLVFSIRPARAAHTPTFKIL